MFFYGNFALMSPAGLFQILCQERQSVVISAWHGASKACIHVAEGAIISACCDDLDGPEAIYCMLAWTWGQFCLESVSADPATPSLSDCWEHLVLEAARRRDEQGDKDEPLPPGPSQQQLTEFLENCPALGGAAIVGYDGRLLAAVKLTNSLVLHATTLARSLAILGTTLGEENRVSLYMCGQQRLLLTEWDDQTLLMAVPASSDYVSDALIQLSSLLQQKAA
jgi:hypothetical protein